VRRDGKDRGREEEKRVRTLFLKSLCLRNQTPRDKLKKNTRFPKGTRVSERKPREGEDGTPLHSPVEGVYTFPHWGKVS